MAHYAELDENNIVLRVVVVNNDYEPTEAAGIAWCEQFFGGGTWIKTSYNTNIRKNFAGKGYTYDQVRDAFIAPPYFADWVLNEETCRYVPPVPMPDDGKQYDWIEFSGWVEVPTNNP